MHVHVLHASCLLLFRMYLYGYIGVRSAIHIIYVCHVRTSGQVCRALGEKNRVGKGIVQSTFVSADSHQRCAFALCQSASWSKCVLHMLQVLKEAEDALSSAGYQVGRFARTRAVYYPCDLGFSLPLCRVVEQPYGHPAATPCDTVVSSHREPPVGAFYRCVCRIACKAVYKLGFLPGAVTPPPAVAASNVWISGVV